MVFLFFQQEIKNKFKNRKDTDRHPLQTEDKLVLYVLERNIIIKKATLLIMGSVVIL